jgi:hypothetical protein
MIAEMKRKICRAGNPTEHNRFCLLACSEGIEVGDGKGTEIDDRILSVCGLADWLVVRKLDESDNSVRIISPCGMVGRGPIPKTDGTATDGDFTLESRFVEYRIH